MAHATTPSFTPWISRTRKICLGLVFALTVVWILKRGDRQEKYFKLSVDIIDHIQKREKIPLWQPLHLEWIWDLFVTHGYKTLYTLIWPLKPLDWRVTEKDVIWVRLLWQQSLLWMGDSVWPNFQMWWNETRWFDLSDEAQEIIVKALQKHLDDGETLPK